MPLIEDKQCPKPTLTCIYSNSVYIASMDAGRCFYPAIKFEFARFYKPQIKTSLTQRLSYMSCRPPRARRNDGFGTERRCKNTNFFRPDKKYFVYGNKKRSRRTSSSVELGGLEPPSRQVTNLLSTCLSGGWLSGRLRTSAPKATRSL